LLPALEELEEVDEVAAVTRRATSTNALITKLVKPPLKDSIVVRNALIALSKTIGDAITLPVPRIHVLSATYGDLRPGAPKWRTCDATATLTSTCERLRTCPIPAPANLCGFDPAAPASDAIKGLTVTYQCVTGDDSLWATLGGKPPKKAASFDTYTSEFRKETQSIVCLQVER
jgi:hypothetical protein